MKKGTRICAAGLLALTMALGAAPALGAVAPATALAYDVSTSTDSATVGKGDIYVLSADGMTLTDMTGKELADVLNGLTEAGQTVYLGEGTYDLGTAAAGISQPCTIKGAGVGTTVIKGQLTAKGYNVTGYASKSVDVQDLTMCATQDRQIAVTNNTGDLAMNFSNVEFKGYYNAVRVCNDIAGADANDDTSVSFDNVKLTNDFVALSIQDGINPEIAGFDVTDDSSYLYAVEGYAGNLSRWGLYPTVDAYEADLKAASNRKSDNWNNVNEDKKLEFYGGKGLVWSKENGYVCVATNGEYKYTDVAKALHRAEKGDTVSLVADAATSAASDVDANDVTLEGNGHTVVFDADLTVDADNFTAQNVTLASGENGSLKFANAGSNNYIYTSNLKDVTLNNSGTASAVINLAAGSLNVEGNLKVVPNTVKGVAAIEVTGTASVGFASDATVEYVNVSVKDIAFAKLVADDKGVTGKVTSANPNIVVDTQEFDTDKDDVTEYALVYVSAKPAEAQDVTMTRLYNPYTGEHLYTADADEVQALVTMGWNDEGAKWVAPAESDTPVYRLYNPYNDEHHYTTDENEVAELVKIGWKDEGVKFYSADESGTPVYRLFNPYAERYTHLFTTDGNEAAELQQQGWSYEGVGFYGVK